MQQYSTVIFIALLVAAFYFLILRPQRKRQQALQHTMNALSPGSRVMLGSGVFGTVLSVGPRQVVLEISPGAELTVLKQAISKVVTEDDEDVLEEDELEEGVASLDESIEPQNERPFEEPTTASNTEPAAEPDSSSTPRDSKPPTAD
ncbi:MAG TPA: preprotein translocase subunit YajC [Propionibacteriaceae bacterium]|jgi:preprotein translocase subunit YajC|nr:preprotein translocase subunit YajC [Propionibacteriaceae bacterium]